MPVYDEWGREITNIGQLVDRRNFIRRIMNKYNIESIYVINALKVGLAMARRSSSTMHVKDLYQKIEESVDKCIEGNKINMECFSKSFNENITKMPTLPSSLLPPQRSEGEDVSQIVNEIIRYLRTVRELIIKNLQMKRVDAHTLDNLIDYLKSIIELIDTLRKVENIEQRLLK